MYDIVESFVGSKTAIPIYYNMYSYSLKQCTLSKIMEAFFIFICIQLNIMRTDVTIADIHDFYSR